MKVIFVDFDGVLNSQGSFIHETRRRKEYGEQGLCRVPETLCHVCASNFQYVLDQYKEVKLVISSTWRELYDLDWLRAKLAEYHIDSSRVIDKTPVDWGRNRGLEIQQWLSEHPEVTHYAIIDDNDDSIKSIHTSDRFVQTTWHGGMTFDHALELINKLSNKNKKAIQE